MLESGGMYGAENVVINLCKEMIKSEKYDPIIGCIVQNSDQDVKLYEVASALNITAKKFVINNFALIKDLPTFALDLKRYGIDLIHCHGYKASVYSFLCTHFARIPTMATCHLWFEGSNTPAKMRIMICLEKFFYRFFPVVVGVSEEICKILHNAGIPQRKIRLIQNGIDLERYDKGSHQDIERLRRELSLQKNEYAIFNVARLAEQKAQEVLIDAAKLIVRVNPNTKFFIIGEGELYSDLDKAIKSKGLSSSVKLLGFRDDIPALLKLADIFALPSLDEGMPIALLEAIACKVPVITTPVGDIPKLITHEKSGILVQKQDTEGLAQAILDLITNSQKRKKLANEAWQQVQTFYSSQAMFAEYDKIYSSILAKQA